MSLPWRNIARHILTLGATRLTRHTLAMSTCLWHFRGSFRHLLRHLSCSLGSLNALICALRRLYGIGALSLLCTLHRIGSQHLSNLCQRILTCLLYLLTNRIVSVDIHRIRAHKDAIALRSVVADKRRFLGYKDISRLLPILAPITKNKHLLRLVVNLNVALQAHVVTVTIVIQCIAQQFVIFGKDIAVFGQRI